jgi:hypothetical protein
VTEVYFIVEARDRHNYCKIISKKRKKNMIEDSSRIISRQWNNKHYIKKTKNIFPNCLMQRHMLIQFLVLVT